MKTLLFNPPSSFNGKFVSREQCGIGLVKQRFIPSEILLCTAYLQVLGYDAGFADADNAIPDFSAYEAVVVWVSVLHTYHQDLEWLRRAKESGCRTVLVLNEPYDGFEADTLRRNPFIDAAVSLWERERSLADLLGAWRARSTPRAPGVIFRENDGLHDTGLHPVLPDLSHLPSCAPLLRSLQFSRYQAAGITPGRGCSGLCGFCLYAGCVQRKRRLADVMEEIEAVADQVKVLFILDPDLRSTRRWTQEFCRQIMARRLNIRWRSDLRPQDAEPRYLDLLRASGCDYVLIAVETLHPEIREKVGAGVSAEDLRTAIRAVRKAGIRPHLYFYIGLPWDSAASLGRIEEFVRSESVSNFFLKQVRPWPGSPVGNAFRSTGLLDRDLGVEDFVHSDSPLCPTSGLSEEDLAGWKSRIGRAAILQPAYLWRFLRERRLTARHVRQFLSLFVGRNIFPR